MALDWETAFDCLEAPARRTVLFGLLRARNRPIPDGGESPDPPGVAVDTLGDDLDDASMHHVHLPKLRDAGYVESRAGGDRVVAGEAFEEIRPLLSLLDRNAAAFQATVA